MYALQKYSNGQKRMKDKIFTNSSCRRALPRSNCYLYFSMPFQKLCTAHSCLCLFMYSSCLHKWAMWCYFFIFHSPLLIPFYILVIASRSVPSITLDLSPVLASFQVGLLSET